MSKFDRDFDSRYTVSDDYGFSQAETIRLSIQGPSVIQGVSAIYAGVYPAGWSYASPAQNATTSNTANTTPQSVKADAEGMAEITIPAIDDLKKQYEELKKQVASLEQKNSAFVLALNKVVARLENLEQQQARRQAPGGYWEET